MKKQLFWLKPALAVFFVLFIQSLQAQYVEDFNNLTPTACNRSSLLSPNQCWQFSSAVITGTPNISGCSIYSSALSNSTPNTYVVRTPALYILSGATIKFKHRVTNTSSTPTLTVYAQDPYTLTESSLLSVSGSVALASESLILGLPTGYYRLRFVMSGSGGSSRMLIDDIEVSSASVVETVVAGVCTLPTNLPVQLSSFTALAKTKGSTALQWETATELNSKNFEVEHSSDGIRFGRIGLVAAAGNAANKQHYQFLHPTALAGNNYYRLKMVDKDGRFAYSDIVVVRHEKASTELTVFPNPVVQQLTIVADNLQATDIQLFDLTGRQVQVPIKQLAPNRFELDCSHLPNGVWLVKAKDAVRKISK
jgi:hypothetical protein